MTFSEYCEKSVSDLTPYLKYLRFIIPLIGFIYLNSYLSEYSIPFPIELSVLPALLLISGIISIFVSMLLLGYVVLVSFTSLDIFSINLHTLINTSYRKKGSNAGFIDMRRSNHFRYILVSYVLPFTFLLVIIWNTDYAKNNIWPIAFPAGYIVWSFLYGLILGHNAENKLSDKVKTAFKIAIHVFCLHVFSIASFAVFFVLIFSRANNVSNGLLIVICAAYIIINSFCLLPFFSKERFEKIHLSGSKFTPEELLKRSHRSPLLFVLPFLFALSLLPPFSAHIGEMSLKLINLGRMNSDVTIKDVKANCDAWPQFIKQKTEETHCVSMPGRKIVQFGSRAYFVFEKEDAEPLVISIDVSKATLLQALPEKSIFKPSRQKHDAKAAASLSAATAVSSI